MYDINLIRKDVVPNQRKRVIFSLVSFSALLCILTVLGVVFLSTANFRMIDVYAHEIDRLEDDISTIYPGTAMLDELASIMREIKPDLKEIGGAIDSRTEITQIWEAVAGAVGDDVWLTHVGLKTPRDQGRKTSFRGIVIEGHALSSGDTSSEEAIQSFATRLKEDPELRSHIATVKFAETGKSKIDGRSVIGFEITCMFKRL